MIILKNWSVFSNNNDRFKSPELSSFRLQGNVYGHPRFNDGDPVNTSRIVEIIDKGTHKEAVTYSGSEYMLYKKMLILNVKNNSPIIMNDLVLLLLNKW